MSDSWKVTVSRCFVLALVVLVLRWQDAPAYFATAVGLIFCMLVFPNHPIEPRDGP